MVKVARLALGVLLLLVSLLGCASFADPELPLKFALRFGHLGGPVDRLAETWLNYTHYLQNAQSFERVSTLLVCLSMAAVGVLTCWKHHR